MKNVNPIESGGGDIDGDIQTQVRILQSRVLCSGARVVGQPRPDNLQPPTGSCVAESAEDQSSDSRAAVAGARHGLGGVSEVVDDEPIVKFRD